MVSPDKQIYTLYAPIDGLIVPVQNIPDPVFSQGIMGPGIAIEPLGTILCAPAAGKIIQCAAGRHAVTLEIAPGVEILLHLGIDTVHLNGEGLEMLVHEGQHVESGAPLIRFDSDRLAQKAASLITPIISISKREFRVTALAHGKICAGAPMAELHPVSAANENRECENPATENFAEEQAVIALENGLHARPAARLGQIAQRYNVKIILKYKDKEANVTRLAALLNLGLKHNDSVAVLATGAQAGKAAADIKKLLETPEGIAAAAILPVPRQRNSEDGILHGVTASPGYAIGRLRPFIAALPQFAEQGEDIATEKQKFRNACRDLQQKLQNAAQSSGHNTEQADILAAHKAFLDDDELIAQAVTLIEMGKSAAAAWKIVMDSCIAQFAASPNLLIRERGGDLRDLQIQLIRLLVPQTHKNDEIDAIFTGNIVIAADVTPSQMIALIKAKPAGLCLAAGGVTSHVALLCRSAGIPCLMGLGDSLADYNSHAGKTAILDTMRAVLELDPADEQIRETEKHIFRQKQEREHNQAEARLPAITRDNVTIQVAANIIGSAGAERSADMGADAVGLFRTEFLFFDRDQAPSEEEQRREYQRTLDAASGRPVVIRMLDIGADKQLSWLKVSNCPNPALSIRGIRLVETHSALIETQLRALLQVKAKPLEDGKSALQIMLPMVSDIQDILPIRKMMEELAQQMGLKNRQDFIMPQLGVMIEVPSAALIADQLAEAADFFSIGTNDLTQYCLAMDREEPKLGPRLDILHPALLRLITLCCEAAEKHKCMVAVCGAAAADNIAGPVLAAIGVRKLSMEAQHIATMKARLRKIDLKALRQEVKKSVNLLYAADIRAALGTYLSENFSL